MKSKSKLVIVQTPAKLAEALGLSAIDAAEMEVRSELNDKIIKIVKSEALTHAQVAKLAGTSRTRLTAIMNRNLYEVSTDLLLRILAGLGYQAKLVVTRRKPAA